MVVKRVWRLPGEEYKDKCVLPTVKHGGGSVMVWGCMSAAGTGELQFIEGTMNANMYCDILKQRLGRRAVFQHDNGPKHTSKTTTVLLKKLRVKVMDWPSMSPDLHPIKHLENNGGHTKYWHFGPKSVISSVLSHENI